MERRLLPDLFHVAEAAEWAAARSLGSYTRSTKGAGLDEVGFLHASFAWQVAKVANLLYSDAATPLVLLRIDVSRLDVPVRVEPAPGGSEGFPHLYGPLSVEAVVETFDLVHSAGAYELPAELRVT